MRPGMFKEVRNHSPRPSPVYAFLFLLGTVSIRGDKESNLKEMLIHGKALRQAGSFEEAAAVYSAAAVAYPQRQEPMFFMGKLFLKA